VEAVVMAAGEGTRLRPLTERWPKPVLPIDGRPVIATLLHELAGAGCERVTVVTGHLAEGVERLVGDGTAFGLAVGFVRQPQPEGSADAVARALEAGAALPCLVAGADTAFGAGDLSRFAAAYAAGGADSAIAVRRDPPPSAPHRYAVAISDGRVQNLSDEDPANPLAGAPLWVVGPETAARLCLDEPPYELRNAFQRAIDEGVEVSAVEIGSTRDLTRPEDLVVHNFPYLLA
jgi:UDP-N-acetylglucosamine diphosphorylase / glucose-1-phosphate thymidylyltransferase / UDP-N-acetylgalactosamine diphosphorylase / glucosamine-1-phosphate N-acetyltransferase / galactosamine-1-phosphate N-acetyltransferase